MVKLTPEEQESFVRAEPEVFMPFNRVWGRDGGYEGASSGGEEGHSAHGAYLFAHGVTKVLHGIANFASRFAYSLLDTPFAAVVSAVVFHTSIAHHVPNVLFYCAFCLIDLASNLSFVW